MSYVINIIPIFRGKNPEAWVVIYLQKFSNKDKCGYLRQNNTTLASATQELMLRTEEYTPYVQQ